MIDERHIKMIELLVSGEYKITEIAELIGVARQTIYDWLKREDVKAELDERLRVIRTNSQKLFDAKLDKAIDEYWKLAMTTTDVRTKQVALSYWIDRALGKTTSRLEMTDNRTDTYISEEDILADIEELEDELDEDNVIELKKAK